jgi:hypothetical protein
LRHLVVDQRSAESNLSAAWSASWESFVKTKLMVSMMSGECPPNPPNDPYFPRREKPGVFKLVQTSRPPMYDNRCQELVRSVAKVSKDADGDSTDRVTHTRFSESLAPDAIPIAIYEGEAIIVFFCGIYRTLGRG